MLHGHGSATACTHAEALVPAHDPAPTLARRTALLPHLRQQKSTRAPSVCCAFANPSWELTPAYWRSRSAGSSWGTNQVQALGTPEPMQTLSKGCRGPRGNRQTSQRRSPASTRTGPLSRLEELSGVTVCLSLSSCGRSTVVQSPLPGHSLAGHARPSGYQSNAAAAPGI